MFRFSIPCFSIVDANRSPLTKSQVRKRAALFFIWSLGVSSLQIVNMCTLYENTSALFSNRVVQITQLILGLSSFFCFLFFLYQEYCIGIAAININGVMELTGQESKNGNDSISKDDSFVSSNNTIRDAFFYGLRTSWKELRWYEKAILIFGLLFSFTNLVIKGFFSKSLNHPNVWMLTFFTVYIVFNAFSSTVPYFYYVKQRVDQPIQDSTKLTDKFLGVNSPGTTDISKHPQGTSPR